LVAQGYRSEQEWYNAIVDLEIEKAARSVGAEQGGIEKDIKHIIAESEDLSNVF
jgi:hypothetical protein